VSPHNHQEIATYADPAAVCEVFESSICSMLSTEPTAGTDFGGADGTAAATGEDGGAAEGCTHGVAGAATCGWEVALSGLGLLCAAVKLRSSCWKAAALCNCGGCGILLPVAMGIILWEGATAGGKARGCGGGLAWPRSMRIRKRCSKWSSSCLANWISEMVGCMRSRKWYTRRPRHDAPAYFLVTRIGSQLSLSARYERSVAPSGKVRRPVLK